MKTWKCEAENKDDVFRYSMKKHARRCTGNKYKDNHFTFSKNLRNKIDAAEGSLGSRKWFTMDENSLS